MEKFTPEKLPREPGLVPKPNEIPFGLKPVEEGDKLPKGLPDTYPTTPQGRLDEMLAHLEELFGEPASLEKQSFEKMSGEELANTVTENPQAIIEASPEENAKEVAELCEEITEAFENEEEVVVSGGLRPQYQKMIDNGEYESVEELCNALGLDYEDVYTYTEKPYGEEYRKGFEDAVNGKYMDPDEQSDAYKDGCQAAGKLLDLMEE